MKLIRLEIKSLWNHIKYLNEISFFDFRFIDKCRDMIPLRPTNIFGLTQ